MRTRSFKFLWILGSACALAACDAKPAADTPAAAPAPVRYEDYEAPPPMLSAGPISERARGIFSDFGERWRYSDVRYIGKLVIGPDYLAIYQFDFVNPQSKHGTQLIALLRNGTEFVGRYAVNGHGSGTEAVVTGLDGATIIFTCDDPPPQRVERFTFSGRNLPATLPLCGKEATLETDGI